MFNLASAGWFFVLLFLLFTVCIGLLQRRRIACASDFLHTGGNMPGWLRGVAFAASGVSAQMLLAMGAAGAQYGLRAVWLFVFGATAAVLAAGLYFVPLYVRAGARSVPEFLGSVLGSGVRRASALLLAAATFASAALSLALMARLVQALHLADALLFAAGIPRQWAFAATVVLLMTMVALYVLAAGVAATAANQMVQFCMLLAGLLPAVSAGIGRVGGWSGLKAALPDVLAKTAPDMQHSAALLLAAGVVLGTSFWCVDQRPLQMALGAKSREEARTAAMVAAPLLLVVAALVVISGAIALALPTPQSSTTVHEENGVIYHEVTVVPPEAAEGQGLVPAHLDPSTHAPQHTANGRTVLDTALATPSLLGSVLPVHLLALGVAALLATLMSGLAAALSAFTSLVVCDVSLQPAAQAKDTTDGPPASARTLRIARWTMAAAAYLLAACAWLLGRAGLLAENRVLDEALLLLAAGAAPVLATVLAVVFFRRIAARGTLAGLFAGLLAAVLHYGLTLPAEALPGVQGGWITAVFRYPSALEQSLVTALLAMSANLAVAWLLSLHTEPNRIAAPQPAGKARAKKQREFREHWPKVYAALLLVAAAAVCLFLAY